MISATTYWKMTRIHKTVGGNSKVYFKNFKNTNFSKVMFDYHISAEESPIGQKFDIKNIFMTSAFECVMNRWGRTTLSKVILIQNLSEFLRHHICWTAASIWIWISFYSHQRILCTTANTWWQKNTKQTKSISSCQCCILKLLNLSIL